MAKKKKFEILAKNIISLVGGKTNISYFTHCVTRLRFNIKDKGMVKIGEIEKIEGVVGCQWSGEQFQIIIGNSVKEAYEDIKRENDLEETGTVESNIPKQKGNNLNRIIQYISGSIIETMAPMLGCAWINILLTILTMFNLINTEGSTYKILYIVANTFSYFIPIMVANAAAKRLKTNNYMAMTLAAILISPDLVNLFGTGDSLSIFSLPITNATYSGSIFPILLIVPTLKYVDDFVGKFIPTSLKIFLQPFLTLMIMVPIALVVLGPIGAILGNCLASMINYLYGKSAWLTIMLLCAIFPFVVMTGMHWALIPLIMTYWLEYGFDPIIMVSMLVHNMAEGSATLAVAFKSKNTMIKSTAGASGVSCIVAGVTEPALYGINLKYKTPLIAVCIGSGLAGLFAGLMGIASYGGASNILGVVGFFGDKGMANVYMGIITMVIAMIVSFVVTFVLYKDPSEE